MANSHAASSASASASASHKTSTVLVVGTGSENPASVSHTPMSENSAQAAPTSPVLVNRLSGSALAASASANGQDFRPAVVYAESVLKELKRIETSAPSPVHPESPSSYSESSLSEIPSLQKRKSAFALFRHQVAGHLPLFWSHGKICKPAFPTEIEFYLHVAEKLPTLVPFIPQFMDIVQLIHLSSSLNDPSMLMTVSDSSAKETKVDESDSSKWGVLGVNDELQSKINKLDNRYLVLQDLTYGYKRPCILDLKLGTRQHGLNASDAKIKSKTAKVNSTTSKSLGLRVCGMQVYMPWKNEFIFKDKYFGRALDDEKFESNLYSYFHNGYHLRTDCMQIAIDRLKGLRDVMATQSSYVFYACSILLIYEGYVSNEEFEQGLNSVGATDASPSIAIVPDIRKKANSAMSISSIEEDTSKLADMRLIDFAHTYVLEDGAKDEDSGVVYGLDKLIEMLEKFIANEDRAMMPTA